MLKPFGISLKGLFCGDKSAESIRRNFGIRLNRPNYLLAIKQPEKNPIGSGSYQPDELSLEILDNSGEKVARSIYYSFGDNSTQVSDTDLRCPGNFSTDVTYSQVLEELGRKIPQSAVYALENPKGFLDEVAAIDEDRAWQTRYNNRIGNKTISATHATLFHGEPMKLLYKPEHNAFAFKESIRDGREVTVQIGETNKKLDNVVRWLNG